MAVLIKGDKFIILTFDSPSLNFRSVNMSNDIKVNGSLCYWWIGEKTGKCHISVYSLNFTNYWLKSSGNQLD